MRNNWNKMQTVKIQITTGKKCQIIFKKTKHYKAELVMYFLTVYESTVISAFLLTLIEILN